MELALRWLGRLVCLIALFGGANLCRGEGGKHSAYRVRVAYVIPSDRKPQADYQAKVAVLLSRIQNFYADQMEFSGFGRMTFEFEAEADGKPTVHLIHSPLTAAVFADSGHARYTTGKYWEHAFQSVIDGGFAPDAQGEVWICFAEAQEQQPDGTIRNDTCQGSGRYGNGFALCSGLELAVGGDPNLIHEDRRYGGQIIPAIGPHPLLWHVSFPAYEGDDVSSLAADFVCATAHELGHCFLLQHCYLNDETQCGNLMGNGFRGARGYFEPDKFPNEDTRLDRPSAIMLSLSPFLRRPTELIKYSAPPRITITTPPGRISLDHGVLRVTFEASEPDGPGIALATLENGRDRDNVGVVAWQEFDGKTKRVQGSLTTNNLNPGQEDTWRVTVQDTSGNVSYQTVKLTAPHFGIGPSPVIYVHHVVGKPGSPMTFRGSVRRPWRFSYLWDFGDGTKGEGPGLNHIFEKPGIYEVRLTAIDPGGRAGTISQFVCIRSNTASSR